MFIAIVFTLGFFAGIVVTAGIICGVDAYSDTRK